MARRVADGAHRHYFPKRLPFASTRSWPSISGYWGCSTGRSSTIWPWLKATEYLAIADVLAATGRKADAVTAAEQAVKLAHPNEPRPKQALEALKK